MRFPFLAILTDQPRHGYEIKQAFDLLFAGARPRLNAGQVYTTLGRLERDELVQSEGVTQTKRPNKRIYTITQAGRDAVIGWITTPTERKRLDDDFFMKLTLAQAYGIADPQSLIQQQRWSSSATLRDLQDLVHRINTASPRALYTEGTIMQVEADLKWLEYCESQLINTSASQQAS